MPYIITTYPMAPGFVGTRRAVATLDEARDYVHQHGATFSVAAMSVTDPDATELDEPFRVFTEAGGSIGPLPDGTVIEVRHAPLGSQADAAQWCEIYNRHHATETVR